MGKNSQAVEDGGGGGGYYTERYTVSAQELKYDPAFWDEKQSE